MSEKKRPNILLITSDQQHWNTLSCMGSEVKTPALDRLASEGTLFDRAYCPNPTCTPTRASIITGKYPSQHGAYSLGTKLPEDQITIGELLQQEGYDASLIGKAHFQPLRTTEEFSSIESYPLLRDLDYWKEFDGPFYGFNHIELARNHADESHAGQHYALWMEEKGFGEWRKHFQNVWNEVDFSEGEVNPPQHHKWTIPEEFHYNNWIYERTAARLDKVKSEEKPFFMWASFFDPHPPYLIPEPWDKMYDPDKVTVPQITPGELEKMPLPTRLTQEKDPDFSQWNDPEGNDCHGFHSHLESRGELAKDIANYYGMVSCLDKYIGKIIDHLDSLGLAENTLVVFTSDHGHYFGHHGLTAKGAFHYEDGIKVPMIVRWPGKVAAGERSSSLQSLVDYSTTFLGALGLPIPRDMTGKNQWDVWQGKADMARDHILVENRHQPNSLYELTYVNSRYKINTFIGAEYGEIYDLENDPNERINLWDNPEYLELKSDLLLKLIQANQAKEPVPMPRIAGA